jgi:AcrR family transcriptional regulator
MGDGNAQQAIRRRLGDSTDPRAARVRSRLFAAAERLGRSGQAVSVSTLVRDAEVSRSVFYAHFSDIADFASQMQRQRVEALVSAFDDVQVDDLRQAGLEGQRVLVAHFADNRDLYRAVLSLTGPAGIIADTTEVLQRAVVGHIRRFCRLPHGLTEDRAATFIAGGTASLVSAWLSDEDPVDQESLARTLMALMPNWLYDMRHSSDDGDLARVTEDDAASGEPPR